MIALICFIVFSQAYKPVLYAPLLDRGSINYNKQGICIDMDLLDLMNTLFLKAKLSHPKFNSQSEIRYTYICYSLHDEKTCII